MSQINEKVYYEPTSNFRDVNNSIAKIIEIRKNSVRIMYEYDWGWGNRETYESTKWVKVTSEIKEGLVVVIDKPKKKIDETLMIEEIFTFPVTFIREKEGFYVFKPGLKINMYGKMSCKQFRISNWSFNSHIKIDASEVTELTGYFNEKGYFLFEFPKPSPLTYDDGEDFEKDRHICEVCGLYTDIELDDIISDSKSYMNRAGKYKYKLVEEIRIAEKAKIDKCHTIILE